jgi:hypothetical protein
MKFVRQYKSLDLIQRDIEHRDKFAIVATKSTHTLTSADGAAVHCSIRVWMASQTTVQADEHQAKRKMGERCIVFAANRIH